MHHPLNQVHLRGFLTEPARLFVSRSGQPRITFRLEVWIDDADLPPKKPAGVDYFSVVAFGEQFVSLLAQLATDREVTLSGRLRSRDVDVDVRRVVTEIVAKEITFHGTRIDALRDRRPQPASVASTLNSPGPRFEHAERV
jgi:single-stranded DNA-binding protein